MEQSDNDRKLTCTIFFGLFGLYFETGPTQDECYTVSGPGANTLPVFYILAITQKPISLFKKTLFLKLGINSP